MQPPPSLPPFQPGGTAPPSAPQVMYAPQSQPQQQQPYGHHQGPPAPPQFQGYSIPGGAPPQQPPQGPPYPQMPSTFQPPSMPQPPFQQQGLAPLPAAPVYPPLPHQAAPAASSLQPPQQPPVAAAPQHLPQPQQPPPRQPPFVAPPLDPHQGSPVFTQQPLTTAAPPTLPHQQQHVDPQGVPQQQQQQYPQGGGYAPQAQQPYAPQQPPSQPQQSYAPQQQQYVPQQQGQQAAYTPHPQQQQQQYSSPPQPQQPQYAPQQQLTNNGSFPNQAQQQQQPQQPASFFSPTGSFHQNIATPTQPGPNGTPPPTPKSATLPPGQRAQRARPAPATRRIDLQQVPSPCRDLPIDSANASRLRYMTSTMFPPLSVTNFVAHDDGNANLKCLRMTLNGIPHDETFVKESGVPLGAVISPLSFVEAEERVPVVSGRPPVRCKRCRAYIHAHTQFTQLGRSWVCCFCDMTNDVSTEYFCNLDGNNRRRDVMEKYELCRGSVEFDVQGLEDYASKSDKGEVIPARPMSHLFVIDVAQRTTHTHLVDLADSLRNSIHQMDPRCRVSFITYASTLHFYNFKHPQVPQLMVADVDNPFVPLPFNLLCWMSVQDDIEKVEAFLDRLVQLSEATDEGECCMGAAVKVANLILSDIGGRVILTGHKAPATGVGAITKPREQHKLYGTDKEKELLRPMDGFWTSTALESAKRQISFDLLMFASDYCELVTLGQLCHLTNGVQHLFVNYTGSNDRLRLQAAIDASLLQEAGYGGILRVRCSNGLRVKSYRGHFLNQDQHDMDLATVQSSSTFFVEIGHESKLDVKSCGFVQCAMLYTTRGGQRRVRVHTVRLPVSNTYAQLYKNADLEAVTTATVHDALFDAVNKGPKAARDALTERTIKLLVSYRKYCSAGSRATQLLMPEMLKLLPDYTLCLSKSDALTVGTSTRIDERVQCIHDLMAMPTHRLLQFLYPRMYQVHNLLGHPTAGTINAQTGLCHFPPALQLTSDSIMSHGIYVLHDQQAKQVCMWIGSLVPPKAASILFGTEDASVVGRTLHGMDSYHERLRNLLNSVMLNDTGSMDRLLIVHEKESAEEAFWRNMLEDENAPGLQSYSDMLCHLHAQVNSRLS